LVKAFRKITRDGIPADAEERILAIPGATPGGAMAWVKARLSKNPGQRYHFAKVLAYFQEYLERNGQAEPVEWVRPSSGPYAIVGPIPPPVELTEEELAEREEEGRKRADAIMLTLHRKAMLTGRPIRGTATPPEVAATEICYRYVLQAFPGGECEGEGGVFWRRPLAAELAQTEWTPGNAIPEELVGRFRP
jgi:hypothetical protein